MQSNGTSLWTPSRGPKGCKRVWYLGLLTVMATLTVIATACGVGTQLAGQSPQPNMADTRVQAAVAVEEQSNQDAKFFLYVETLSADRPSVYGYIAPRGCTPSGVFKRTERVVWRFEILDVATGKLVTSVQADSVLLRLPYGVDQQAEFKQRGEGRVPDAPSTWDVCWDVPPDYPLGVLDYTIAIKLKDGRTGTWKPPALVDPGRGIDTRPQVIE
ncbi:MAG: hypothetical protein HYX79_06350 [Chloroflexi bacterium]|nr:hypothetical protein [Chloroflexota bacterium]